MHGVTINEQLVQPRYFHSLQPGMTLKFGLSMRTYVVRQGVAIGASNNMGGFEQAAASAIKNGRQFVRRTSGVVANFTKRTEAVVDM